MDKSLPSERQRQRQCEAVCTKAPQRLVACMPGRAAAAKTQIQSCNAKGQSCHHHLHCAMWTIMMTMTMMMTMMMMLHWAGGRPCREQRAASAGRHQAACTRQCSENGGQMCACVRVCVCVQKNTQNETSMPCHVAHSLSDTHTHTSPSVTHSKWTSGERWSTRDAVNICLHSKITTPKEQNRQHSML